MKIVIYISHPAQYLFFKNPIQLWKTHGHELKIFIRTKDVLAQLMKNDNIAYENVMPFGRKSNLLGITKAFISRPPKRYLKILKLDTDFLLGTDG